MLVAATVLAAGASPTAAGVQVTKHQYIAQGEVICKRAISDLKNLGSLYPAARAAAKGSRWLAIDRRTLAGLHALTPPAGDRATTRRLLQLADVAVNTGIANVVAAARTGSNAAYSAAARRATRQINAAHAAASAYGFSACARW